MIKLSANLSKKVPMPDVEFSSQQYGAVMEIEVSDSAGSQGISGRLEAIYKLLERSIDSQIVAASKASQPAAAEPPKRPFLDESNEKPQPEGSNGNGASRRDNGHASPAQVKMIFGLCKGRNVSREDLVKLLQGEFSVASPEDLTVRQASDFIGRLQKLEEAQRWNPQRRRRRRRATARRNWKGGSAGRQRAPSV